MTVVDRSHPPPWRARLSAGVGAAALTVAALVAGVSPASADTVTTTIPVGTQPFGVAITPDGTRAYITNAAGNTVSVIDTATTTVIGDPIPVGTEPSRVAITPDGSRAYVTNQSSNTVSVIDTATGTVVGDPIRVGAYPVGVAITPDGSRAYVTNQVSNMVSVIAIEQAPTLAGAPAAGTVGQPYDYAFTVTGQPAPTVTAASGDLPDGLSLSAEGVISGIPTAAGRFEFTLTATNGIGDDAVLPVVLEITDTTSTPAGSLGTFGSFDPAAWTS
ncbi:beta-propeller fold lactonase family protein [Rhodococcus hoagii]|nr:beta-propeller fold lactonase family protein [Prescottella equi]